MIEIISVWIQITFLTDHDEDNNEDLDFLLNLTCKLAKKNLINQKLAKSTENLSLLGKSIQEFFRLLNRSVKFTVVSTLPFKFFYGIKKKNILLLSIDLNKSKPG